jgi:hypothetical protein
VSRENRRTSRREDAEGSVGWVRRRLTVVWVGNSTGLYKVGGKRRKIVPATEVGEDTA